MNTEKELLRVLHLEDSTADAELVVRAVRKEMPHAEFDHVVDREDFCQRLQEFDGYDIILADYFLNDFNGLEALEIARREAPSVPFILVSGTMGENLAVRGLHGGAADFVLKHALFRLPNAIRNALRSSEEHARRRQIERDRQQLAEIIEASPDLVGTARTDGKVILLNSSFRTLMGIGPSDDLTDWHIQDFHPPEIFGGVLKPALEQANKIGFWTGESVVLDRDGRRVPVHQSIVSHRNEAGQVTHFSTVVRLIADLKAVQAQLDEERRFLSGVLDSVSARIAILDQSGNIMAANRHWQTRGCLLGQSSPGTNLLARYRSSRGLGGNALAAGIDAVLSGEPAFCMQLSQPGEPHFGRTWFHIAVTRFEQESGQAVAVLAFEDITDRVEAAAEVRRKHELMLAVARSTHHFTWIIEPNGRMVPLIKRSSGSLSGMQASLMQAENVFNALPASDRLKALRAYRVALDSEPQQVEVSFMDGCNSRSLRVTLSRLEAGAETGRVVAVVEDITEVKALGRQLIQASKLATLGEMAAGVAHELNQPLAVVQMAAEMASEELGAPAPDIDFMRERIDRIHAMGERATETIRQLRLFARGAEPRHRPGEIGSAIRDALGLISAQLRNHQITVQLQIPDDLPLVMGDQRELSQVFLNLMLNAMHAIDTLPVGRDRRIALSIAQADDILRVVVQDTGPGLSEEALEKVFVPFFSTKPEGKGTGLGMSIAFGIIQSHSGSITAENAREGGARFTIEVPALQEHADSPSFNAYKLEKSKGEKNNAKAIAG